MSVSSGGPANRQTRCAQNQQPFALAIETAQARIFRKSLHTETP
jgi:hypothetical protein